MHPNPIYRSSHSPEDISFLQDRGFGVLAVNGDAGPLLSHIPFQLSPDTIYIEAHLVFEPNMARFVRRAIVCSHGG